MKNGSMTILALAAIFVILGVIFAAPKALLICLYLAGGLAVTGALVLGLRWWARR
jgi:hypothetical protein